MPIGGTATLGRDPAMPFGGRTTRIHGRAMAHEPRRMLVEGPEIPIDGTSSLLDEW